MDTPLLTRFGKWLGCWRGPATRPDGTRALVEFNLVPHFGGELIQLDARVIHGKTGQAISSGAGLWALDGDGSIVNGMFGTPFGHCVLRERADDEDVLSMEGRLSGNADLAVTFRVVDGEMEFNSRVIEGYATQDDPPRMVAKLRRVSGGKP